MAFVCDTCEPLEGHKYWHDLNINQQFFKIMLGDFESQLRIPRKFVECFRGPLSGTCTLRGPSRNVWEVEILKTNKDVLFSDGWGNFVRDHNIKPYYFLVFRCASDSAFEVSVFDATGCEREGSYFTKNMNNTETSCRSLLHSEHNHSKTANFEVQSDVPAGFISAAKTRKRECKKKSSHCQEQQGCSSIGRQTQKIYVSNRRKVTNKEKIEAFDKASSYVKSNKRSMSPIVEIVMLKSHVCKGFHLTVPQQWARSHMLSESHEINLRVLGENGGSWTVGCRWTSSQCQITRGWSTFVLDNNLEEGDVCVFKLVRKRSLAQKRNPVIHVHIFRVVEDVVPLTVKRC